MRRTEGSRMTLSLFDLNNNKQWPLPRETKEEKFERKVMSSSLNVKFEILIAPFCEGVKLNACRWSLGLKIEVRAINM